MEAAQMPAAMRRDFLAIMGRISDERKRVRAVRKAAEALNPKKGKRG